MTLFKCSWKNLTQTWIEYTTGKAQGFIPQTAKFGEFFTLRHSHEIPATVIAHETDAKAFAIIIDKYVVR